MKNNGIAIMYYICALVSMIVSVIFIVKSIYLSGILYLCLTITWICLGTTYINKKEIKNEKKENNM